MNSLKLDSLDLSHPHCLANPYPILQFLRENEPVYWSPQLQTWVLTDYENILQVLSKSPLSSARFNTASLDGLPPQTQHKLSVIYKFLSHWLVALDASSHMQLRTLLNKAFTPRRMKALRPYIQQVAEDLMSNAQKQGHMDIVEEYAYLLPVHVMAKILGMPVADWEVLRKWSEHIVQFGSGRPGSVGAMYNTVEEMKVYFKALLDQEKDKLEDGLISDLIYDPAETIAWDREQIIANFAFLLFVGHETTTRAIACGAFMLLRSREENVITEVPDTTVEEVLRYDTAVPHIVRIATEDFHLRNQHIQKGDTLTIFLASANRDPAHFHNPDSFCINRPHSHHLSFGYGAHYCLGAPLARIEIQIALSTLLTYLPKISLAPSFDSRSLNNTLFRSKTLPIILSNSTQGQ